MSGIIKSVTKVFKKVVPNLKKILPIGLAIGALVFTAGAALGALPSWGTAVQGVVAKLGISETLAGALTGAVTQAGYGAALGAGGAFLAGKDPSKGALLGALTGAVTGGVTGGLGMETDPLKGLNPDATAAMPGPTQAPGLDGVEQTSNYTAPYGDAGPGGVDSDFDVGGAVTGDGPLPGATSLPENDVPLRRGLYSGSVAQSPLDAPKAGEPKGWLERHQTLVGSTILGAGRAGAQFFASGADAESQQKARDQRANNYRSGTRGLYTEPPADPTNARAPVPTATGDLPRTPQTVGSYRYDKEKGQMVFEREGA